MNCQTVGDKNILSLNKNIVLGGKSIVNMGTVVPRRCSSDIRKTISSGKVIMKATAPRMEDKEAK